MLVAPTAQLTIKTLCREKYKQETELLQQVNGVGIIVSLQAQRYFSVTLSYEGVPRDVEFEGDVTSAR